jgi:glycosyltransferase involved in cell wall biosynthesis
MDKKMSEFRPKVLLLAELADPKMVSVPLVAWSHAQALRKVADVHIVTQIRHRESFIEAGLIEGKDFSVIDTEYIFTRINKVVKFIFKGNAGWTTKMASQLPAYYEFERLVWKKFKNSLKNNEFDLVHRLTPLSPTLPSTVAKKCKQIDIPFVWGPIAGGLPWPKEFSQERKKEREWLSYVRDVYKLMPYFKSSRANANALVIASKDTLSQVPTQFKSKCIYIPENAIDPERFYLQKEQFYKEGERLKLLYIGRLVPYKCLDVVLNAISELAKQNKVTLDVIGDGPEIASLKLLTQRLKIDDSVIFHGNIEHTKVQNIAISCDVLAFPSIREFGGGVVLESMALGVVPIVVDYGGPAELVTKDTGIKIRLGQKSELIHSCREAIEFFLNNPEKVTVMGEASKERINRLYTWDKKAEMMLQVYKWVLDPTMEKPNFGMPLN